MGEFGFVWFFAIFFQERIEQNSQEEIQQDEVTKEDPNNTIKTVSEIHTSRLTVKGIKQYRLPVFHGQDLEHSDESNRKGIKVTSWLGVRIIWVFLNDFASKHF